MVCKMSETNVNSIEINANTIDNKRKFELLSKQTIQSIGQQIGVEYITDEAVLLLSSDVSYRLREVIHSAIEFMRHSKRRRLSTADISRALECSDCERVFGFESNPTAIEDVFIKEANVFVANDSVIDLNEEMEKIFDRNSSDLRLFETDIQMSVQWLTIDGRLPPNEDICVELNDELKSYYQMVVKTILGTDSQSFATVMKDLATNCGITPVMPYFINFLRNGIKKLSHDISQLKRFLHSIQCLFRNPSLFLATDPYLNPIIQSILHCITDPLNPIQDHWSLRDSASHLLVSVLNEWFPPFVGNRPLDQTLDSLRNCLLDFSKPFRCHYGALKAFQSLGFDLIVEHLYPILHQYFTHLLPTIDDENNSIDPQIRSDGLRVFGELLFISELISLKMRSIIANNFETKLDFKVYNQLSDIFGDSLFARLPIDFEKIRSDFYTEKYKNWSKREIRLFETPESHQTGEELLDAFYETPTHPEELRSDMSGILEDDNSFDDNSFLSDNEKETMTSDVMIKSTVSDPTLGIKLTFKLRKDQKQPQKDLRRPPPKRSPSVTSEPIFDTIPLKETLIRFNFSGSGFQNNPIFDQPIQRSNYCLSDWFVLTMTKPKQYVLRRNCRKIVKNERQMTLYSSDLNNIL